MQTSLFDIEPKDVVVDDIINPNTYKGIYSFHKYWGKKPLESIIYFMQKYTSETDIIMDPFLGSGFICNEAIRRNRRFIGVDLNPFSIEHTKFLLEMPSWLEYAKAIREMEKNIKDEINNAYKLEDGMTASHYLWNGNSMHQIWVKPKSGKTRIEKVPSEYDMRLYNSFCEYTSKYIREATFFTNSRINSKNTMSISDLFTKRALRNIDIIIGEINKYPKILQRALYLTLTSASGQMSSMVFAITGRGKTKGCPIAEKIEVGSWVIGFWRPELHFEINVWNCFINKAKKLCNALQDVDMKKCKLHDDLSHLFSADKGGYITTDNCLELMKKIPDNSIQMICTDPPHSDRIPYLELSEIWNSILNKNVAFEKEIVVSNAKERNKGKHNYTNDMHNFMREVSRILKKNGVFLLYFNARDSESWRFMEDVIKKNSALNFIGAFPLEYSANSVVQDNRRGGMKKDYALIMTHKRTNIFNTHEFDMIPGWLTKLPNCNTV